MKTAKYLLNLHSKPNCLSGKKLDTECIATEQASNSHLSKDLTALLMSCNRSTSPSSNRSNSLFNLSCGGRDPSPVSFVCDTVEVGPEELATGIGCFVTVFEPTWSGTEFERFFGRERLGSLPPAVKPNRK